MSKPADVTQEGFEIGVSANPTSPACTRSAVATSHNQEPENYTGVELESGWPAMIITERAINNERENIDNKEDDIDDSLAGSSTDEPVTYSCKESGCQWMCSHHEHLSPKKDFFCLAETFLYHAERGCPGCGLWRDIASSRCVCRLVDEEIESRRRFSKKPHPPESVETTFDGRRLPIVEMFWHCATRGSISIELAGSQDRDISVSRFGGCVHLNRLSPECIALFKDWIHNCDWRHSLCAANNRRSVPKRLLDVGDPGNGEVKLRCMNGELVKYLAFSYCWGGSKPPHTTSDNRLDHERGIAWSALPKSYQDTILLAQKLSVPYVWIDSYCIIQDDKEEKEMEIARMGEIFQNAYLVIIAASSSSPYSGYLRNNPFKGAVDGRASLRWRESSVHYGELKSDTVKFREVVHTPGQGRDACLRMKIAKRAWTYQERLLAPRCLIFQGREVVWECKTCCLCECGGARLGVNYEPQLLPSPQLPLKAESSRGINERLFLDHGEAYSFWRDAVQAFAARDLTYPKDRLPAISALASIVQVATDDQYLAGIWKGDLTRQLAWQNRPSYDDLSPYNTNIYVAPSWSWASTPVPTAYPKHSKKFEGRPRVNLLEARCIRSGLDSHGAVQDGYLLLHGIHCDASAVIWSNSEQWPMITLTLSDGLVHESEGAHSEFSFLDGLRVHVVGMEVAPGQRCSTLQRYHISTSSGQARCSGRARLLWLEDDVCLLLAYSRRVPDAFERIGILDSDMSPPIPAISPSSIRLV